VEKNPNTKARMNTGSGLSYGTQSRTTGKIGLGDLNKDSGRLSSFLRQPTLSRTINNRIKLSSLQVVRSQYNINNMNKKRIIPLLQVVRSKEQRRGNEEYICLVRHVIIDASTWARPIVPI